MNLTALRISRCQSCARSPALNTGYTSDMCKGEVEESNPTEDQMSEASVGHSLGGHPRSQSHQAAQQRVQAASRQQQPGFCQKGGTMGTASKRLEDQ